MQLSKGNIEEGTKLPSKKKLADYLAISQTTIEFAYSQLVAEGFISSEPRKGYFVHNLEELALHRTSQLPTGTSRRK